VGFNYDASSANHIESRDGFMPEFAVADIKDSDTASILYRSLGTGTSPSTFFQSKEQVMFTHPTNGNKFPAQRLRIDCKRDEAYKNFSCLISAVK
jgi:hypothetical protein